MCKDFSIHCGTAKKQLRPAPSKSISMKRLIHHALRRGTLRRNVAFSFCNPVWKSLLKLCISQNAVIALGYNELQKMGVIARKEEKGEKDA